MTSVYLAARYSRHPEMREYAAQLEELGFHVTSRWIKGDHDIRSCNEHEAPHYMPVWAKEDWDDLVAADMVISFTEHPTADVSGRARGGRHVEMGIALAMNKVCIVINFRENVFNWLPQVNFYEGWMPL